MALSRMTAPGHLANRARKGNGPNAMPCRERRKLGASAAARPGGVDSSRWRVTIAAAFHDGPVCDVNRKSRLLANDAILRYSLRREKQVSSGLL